MSFQPVVPFAGHAGWAFLQRTRDSQQEAFDRSPRIERLTGGFEEKIAKITSVDELMADRGLLEVALGAFGLGEDIDNRFYIRKVLESDVTDETTLARRLSDKRYLALATAFGFGDAEGPKTGEEGFGARIVQAYREREFEVALGDQAPQMRLILGLERELDQVLTYQGSNRARWFSIMATPPLREVFEAALNLPQSFGALDLDRQLAEFQSRAEATFGTSEIADFAEPERRDKLISRFLAGSAQGAQTGSTAPGAVALALLQAGG